MDKTVFYLDKGKKIFFSFSLIFSFLKIKEYIHPWCRIQKHFFKLCADFRVTIKIFLGPAPS